MPPGWPRWRYRPRSGPLRADLRALSAAGHGDGAVGIADPSADGTVDPHAAGSPACSADASDAATLAHADDAYAWGMLYVVEGSALGGRLIARHLRRHCPSLEVALRHFDGGPAGNPHTGSSPSTAGWPAFRAALEQALPDAAARMRAVHGAHAMFGRFHHHLDASPRPSIRLMP